MLPPSAHAAASMTSLKATDGSTSYHSREYGSLIIDTRSYDIFSDQRSKMYKFYYLFSPLLGDLFLQPRDVALKVGDQLVQLRLGLARLLLHGLGGVLRLLALLDEAEVLVLEVGEDGEQLLRFAEEQADVLLKFGCNV